MLGFLFIVIGLIHYLMVRDALPLFGLELSIPLKWEASWLPSFIIGSLPSFSFVIGLILLEHSMLNNDSPKHSKKICVKWLLVALFFETIQALPVNIGYFSGVFDLNDCLASILAAFVAYLLVQNNLKDKAHHYWGQRFFYKIPSRISITGIYILALIMITGSSKGRPVGLTSCGYQDSQDFSLDIKWLDPRPIVSNTKITIYENFLFISDAAGGVHILDNSDQRKPTPYGFIDIPGNHDIAVKDNIIYANAYNHLVAIDASTLPEIKILKIIHNALGPDHLFCRGNGNLPIATEERVEATNPNRPEPITSEDPVAPSSTEEFQCRFTTAHEACLVVVESQDGLSLSGCMINDLEESKLEFEYACNIELPPFSRILSHVNICGEQDTAFLVENESSRYLDFWQSSCKTAEEKNNHLTNFYEHFRDYHEQVDFVSSHENYLELLKNLDIPSDLGGSSNE